MKIVKNDKCRTKNLIEKGAFGKVYISSCKKYAIKVEKLLKNCDTRLEDEARILQKCRGDGIPKLKDHFERKGKY